MEQRTVSFGETLFMTIPFFFVLLVGAVGIIYFLIFVIRRIKANSKFENVSNEEPITSKAVVIEKSIIKNDSQNIRAGKKNGEPSYNIVFSLSDGKKVMLEVSDWEYKRMGENDEGMLTYKRDKFIEFQKSY